LEYLDFLVNIFRCTCVFPSNLSGHMYIDNIQYEKVMLLLKTTQN
jgi:hypothetical protein